MSTAISAARLRQLAAKWMERGPVVAPIQVKPGLVQYMRLAGPNQLLLDGFQRPANSIKEWFFPRHEKLYEYRVRGRQVELNAVELTPPPTVILAARPCDAAALPILDPLFRWDYVDEFYFRRRAATMVVTLACSSSDDDCFCTSVGLGPAAAPGSDVLLLPLGAEQFEVRLLTAKGETLFHGATTPGDRSAPEFAGPPRRFETPDAGFDNPAYAERTRACLGCGACAYVCPTCHCFDIADEGRGQTGARVKNWDSCQFPLFTHHASGHNPRANQAQRQRQRIYHKFHVYPEKFGATLCTGCGNCSRLCPVGLGVLPVLEACGSHA